MRRILDCYKTLGVPPSATKQEVKKAFFALAKKHHPDRVSGEIDKFREVRQAYDELRKVRKDPESDDHTHTSSSNSSTKAKASVENRSHGHAHSRYKEWLEREFSTFDPFKSSSLWHWGSAVPNRTFQWKKSDFMKDGNAWEFAEFEFPDFDPTPPRASSSSSSSWFERGPSGFNPHPHSAGSERATRPHHRDRAREEEEYQYANESVVNDLINDFKRKQRAIARERHNKLKERSRPHDGTKESHRMSSRRDRRYNGENPSDRRDGRHDLARKGKYQRERHNVEEVFCDASEPEANEGQVDEYDRFGFVEDDNTIADDVQVDDDDGDDDDDHGDEDNDDDSDKGINYSGDRRNHETHNQRYQPDRSMGGNRRRRRRTSHHNQRQHRLYQRGTVGNNYSGGINSPLSASGPLSASARDGRGASHKMEDLYSRPTDVHNKNKVYTLAHRHADKHLKGRAWHTRIDSLKHDKFVPILFLYKKDPWEWLVSNGNRLREYAIFFDGKFRCSFLHTNGSWRPLVVKV